LHLAEKNNLINKIDSLKIGPTYFTFELLFWGYKKEHPANVYSTFVNADYLTSMADYGSSFGSLLSFN
ncbi:8707_t:CDS:2, partial [Entrophospora sp. SA101]